MFTRITARPPTRPLLGTAMPLSWTRTTISSLSRSSASSRPVPTQRKHVIARSVGVLSAHHALRSAVVPRAQEPAPKPKQLALFVPRGHIELPGTTTLLEAQLRDAPPSRLPWMTLLARVFRIDISVCSRCRGPMRVTRAVTNPQDIAAELHGARPPPRRPVSAQLLLFSATA